VVVIRTGNAVCIHDSGDAARFVGRQLALVEQVQLLDGDAELAQALDGLAVGQPGVLLVHLTGLTAQVIQHVHAELQLFVDSVPIVHNVLFVGAQTHDHPHRQVLEGSHGLGDVAVTRLSISGDDQASLLSGGTQLALDLAQLSDHLADVSAERSAVSGR